jgi:DNA invertase Pin-like site-specific DNA recombinase
MEKVTALYCRVSTALQSSGLEAQKRALEEWCKRKEITGYRIYEDENQSGTKSSRPALDKMMADVRAGGISTVIVYSFSRMARSTKHLLSALEEFKNLGVSFCSVTEQVDTNSPLGIAFFTILACLAQLERDLIVERVKNGLANARAKGKKIGRAKTRPSELIRALLKSGMSHRNISRTLNISNGSVSLEKKIWLEEQRAAKLEAEKIAAQKNPSSAQIVDDAAPWAQ